jgi:hypothetical protein
MHAKERSMNKTVLFPFNGEMMCFIHVLLNALDQQERGYEVKIVVEGSATRLIPELAKQDNPMHSLYVQAKDKGLFAGACRACSAKLGVLEAVQAEGLGLLDDMKGHPSMAAWMEDGYTVITF